MVGQGPAVLAAGAGLVFVFVFFSIFFSFFFLFDVAVVFHLSLAKNW